MLLGVVNPEQVLVVATHDGAVAERLATRHLRVRQGEILEIPVDAEVPA
jgi:predicted ABC-type transport system involved in lysophospholipase L1 biosynthesis ATPase subunit